MNILVVNNKELNMLPPVVNLIIVLLRNGHKVTVITEDSFSTRDRFKNDDNIEFIVLPSVSRKITLSSIFRYIRNKRLIRKNVVKCMKKNDILWTTTDKTVRDIGKLAFKYKHVMQLMELIEDTPIIPKQNVMFMNIKKYARHAFKVVVPEYNRAHIQKAWWELEKLPTILPNKMAEINIDMNKVPGDVKHLLDEIDKENRKIVLYQGVFGNDRNFEVFAQAFNNNSKYKFIIMGRINAKIQILLEKYDDIGIVPFVAPPYHWLFTEKAHIGLLPYQAGKVGYNSILNGIYCAPNKIFDYAAFGVPMIGTDVPGLSVPFKSYGIGGICEEFTVEGIIKATELIEKEYEKMSKSCKVYYDSVDLDGIINNILEI